MEEKKHAPESYGGFVLEKNAHNENTKKKKKKKKVLLV